MYPKCCFLTKSYYWNKNKSSIGNGGSSAFFFCARFCARFFQPEFCARFLTRILPTFLRSFFCAHIFTRIFTHIFYAYILRTHFEFTGLSSGVKPATSNGITCFGLWAECRRRFFYEVKIIVDCTRAVNFLRSKKEGFFVEWSIEWFSHFALDYSINFCPNFLPEFFFLHKF